MLSCFFPLPGAVIFDIIFLKHKKLYTYMFRGFFIFMAGCLLAFASSYSANAANITIAEKLRDLLNTKEAIRQAIVAKGADLPKTAPFSQYAAKICGGKEPLPAPDPSRSAANLTLEEKLQDLLDTKEAIRQAMIANGADVPENTPFSQYPNKIAGIMCLFDGTNCSFSDFSYGSGASAAWGMVSGDSTCNQVKGGSICAANKGTYATRGTPTGSGKNCWCRMTEPREGAWVFKFGYDTASYCSTYCAYACADDIKNKAGFRAAVLGP
jgi:hypothetical protein